MRCGRSMSRTYFQQNLTRCDAFARRGGAGQFASRGRSRSRHPGWGDARTFNFGLPASTSYEVMRAFLHAQAVGGPLKQAVVGLDFFAFNIFFPAQRRTGAGDAIRGKRHARFADFLATELAKRPRGEDAAVQAESAMPKLPAPQRGNGGAQSVEEPEAETWNEALYLAVNPDVAAAVARKEFTSGREHYLLAGRAEGRSGGMIPKNWNENQYLTIHPDVAAEVRRGTFFNGYHHYLVAGKAEGRADGAPRPEWNEALYLRLNPDVQNEIARGTFTNGYHHYLARRTRRGPRKRYGPEQLERRAIPHDPPRRRRRGAPRHVPERVSSLSRGRARRGPHRRHTPARVERGALSADQSRCGKGSARGTFRTAITITWPPDAARTAKEVSLPSTGTSRYLEANRDVEDEVRKGVFLNGYHHYLVAGRHENRMGGMIPREWDEAGYLQVNPDVAPDQAGCLPQRLPPLSHLWGVGAPAGGISAERLERGRLSCRQSRRSAAGSPLALFAPATCIICGRPPPRAARADCRPPISRKACGCGGHA